MARRPAGNLRLAFAAIALAWQPVQSASILPFMCLARSTQPEAHAVPTVKV
jgi:hypothetical protein